MDAGLYGIARDAPEAPPLAPDEVARRLQTLPRSARAVYALLETRGPLTHRDLVHVAGMPARTVRYALQRLRHEGVVGERCSLLDCRQCWFFAVGACDGTAPDGAPLRVSGA